MIFKHLKIKTKLLLSTIVVQAITLLIITYGLYKALEISTFDKIQSNLRIITLDVIDDILHNKKLLSDINFDEDEEFQFKPLYIRIIEPKSKKVIVTTNFPKLFNIKESDFSKLENKKILIREKRNYVISETIIKVRKNIDIIIQIATTKSTLNATLDTLLNILYIITPLIFLLTVVGTILILNKSFKPIGNILNNLKQIQATSLSKRIQSSNSNDEIAELINEINNLLKRIETSFEKTKQFSLDASHELKTPLTIIRGELEITLNKQRTQTEYKQTIQSSLDEIINIQKTIENLLFLAKPNETFKNKNPVYLDEISYESVEELKIYANNRQIDIRCDILEAIEIEGYQDILKIAIKNILKNSISFSHENTKVLIKNYSNEDFYIISIEDKGIGIPEKEQEKIFEKFYRTDKSRDKDSGGTGLGMSICKKIIQIHDAQITIKSKENIGTIIFLNFPKKPK